MNKVLSKYLEFGFIAIKETLTYPANLFGRLAIHVARIVSLGFVYSYLFSKGSVTTGITLQEAVWAIALVQLIYQCSRNTYKTIKDDILSGKVEVNLNKPYSLLISNIFSTIGDVTLKIVPFLIVTVVSLAPIWGIPVFTGAQIIFIVLGFILGVILNVLIEEFIALWAFWIENSDPIYWILTKLSWVFSGTLVPVAIMPLFFQQIANYFPLSLPFALGRVFEFKDTKMYVSTIIVMFVYSILLFLLNNFIYKKGIRKVTINGG